MLETHYLRLWKGLGKVASERDVEVTLAQVAEVLCCTSRNANLLLKRMTAETWLIWQPGRGRGNRSVLTFLAEPEPLLLASCEQLLQAGKLHAAQERLHAYRLSESGQTQWMQLLAEQFGPRTRQGGGQQFDLLRFPFYRSLETLDPFFVSRRTENQLVRQVMEGLVAWSEEKRTWEGRLAHTWECDASGTVYDFYLRKGVRFHHGAELTAADVQATFEWLLDPELNSPYRGMYAALQNIEQLGPYAVRFTLRKAHPLFVNLLGSTCATIQPRDKASDRTPWERMPVGTGPFQVVRNDEEQFVLEVFPGHHAGRPFLDRVEMWVVPDVERLSQITELGGQEVFYFPSRVQEDRGKHLQRVEELEQGCHLYVWNFNRPGPQHDERFRRAFAMLIDPARMVKDLGGNRLRPAMGFIERPNSASMATKANGPAGAKDGVDIARVDQVPDPLITWSARDRLEEAKRMLQACGYQGEALRLLTYRMNTNEENAAWLVERAAEAGVRLVADIRDRAEFVQPKRMQEAHLVCTGWVASEDLELSEYDMLTMDSTAFRDPLGPVWRQALDERVEALLQLPEAEDRQQAYLEIERWLEQEAVVQPLYHASISNDYHPHLQGAKMTVQGHVDFRHLWWKRG